MPTDSISPARSEYAPSAQLINLESPETAEQSLVEMNRAFGGDAKVLFYKEGDNYFAVREKERPWFWWRQLLGRFKGEETHYANADVGKQLAGHFKKTGPDLQKKMMWGWFKQSVASKEFLNPVGYRLAKETDELCRRLECAWRTEKLANYDRCQPPPSSLIGLMHLDKSLRDGVKDGSCSLDDLNDPTTRLADIQFQFWNELFDLLPPDKHRMKKLNAKLELARHLCSYELTTEEGLNLPAAGLASRRILSVWNRWLGDKQELVDLLVRKAGRLSQLPARIDALTQSVSTMELDPPYMPSEDHRAAVLHEASLLKDEWKRLGEPENYDLRAAGRHAIDQRLTLLEASLTSRLNDPNQARDAAIGLYRDAALGLYKVTQCAQQDKIIGKDGERLRPRLSQRLPMKNSMQREVLAQVADWKDENGNAPYSGENAESTLSEELVRMARKREDSSGQARFRDHTLPSHDLSVLSAQVTNGIVSDPRVGALLAEHFKTDVTIYSYDFSKNETARSVFHPSNPAKGVKPIRLAKYRTQFHSVAFEATPASAGLQPQ